MAINLRKLVTRLPLHYSWVVLLATFLTLVAAAGIRVTPTVLIIPFEVYFGWSRTTISLALAISVLLYDFFGPFAAAMMELYGVRRIMLSALSFMLVGAVLSIFMNSVWQMIVLWGVVVGTGTGLLSSVLGNLIASRWFVKHRGVVVGLLSSGSAAGQLIFLPLFAKLLEYYSWQSVFAFIGVFIVLVILFVGVVMRNYPSDIGLLPYGALEPVSEKSLGSGNPFVLAMNGLQIAIHSKEFWLLSGSYFVCGATTVGLIGTHFIPACVEHGFTEFKAAGMLAMAGVLNIIGTTLSGWLSDRFDNRWLLIWYYGFRGVALLCLPFQLNPDTYDILVFVVVYGLDWLATVPPTVRLTSNLFGRQHVVIFGWISVMHQLGAALVTFYAGFLHNIFGNYQWSFMSGAILCFIATAFVAQLPKVQNTKKSSIEIRYDTSQ